MPDNARQYFEFKQRQSALRSLHIVNSISPPGSSSQVSTFDIYAAADHRGTPSPSDGLDLVVG